MTRRYFLPSLPLGGGIVELPDTEAQHAVRVMRVQPNDIIMLFDGRGYEATAHVVQVDRRHCHCRAETAEPVDREPSRLVRIAVVLPKADRAKEMIERLTELGAAEITPLISRRTQRPPSASMLSKLRRAVIESSKQCGRNRLMAVHEPVESMTFFRQAQTETANGSKLVADPRGVPLRAVLPKLASPVTIAIGPEGGWTDEELHQAAGAGFITSSFGPRILRIETAAAFAAAQLCE